jgi:hypothetical protein
MIKELCFEINKNRLYTYRIWIYYFGYSLEKERKQLGKPMSAPKTLNSWLTTE